MIAAALLSTAMVLAQSEPVRPKDAGASAQNAPIERETDEAWRDSVERGLAWLARAQNEDGSFGRGRMSENAGIVSLCALAFMADGSVPGRGRYGAAVERALEYVLKHVTESGLVTSDGNNGPMYGHGFATLFLGEIYGMSPDDVRVRDALVRAVRLIENSQNGEGGWRYNPVPDDADVSVTICQVMALRSARNAGIRIPKDVVDGAVRYVRECQNPDGGFRYMRDHRRERAGRARPQASRASTTPACTRTRRSSAGSSTCSRARSPAAADAAAPGSSSPTTSTATTTRRRRCTSPAASTGPSGGPRSARS